MSDAQDRPVTEATRDSSDTSAAGSVTAADAPAPGKELLDDTPTIISRPSRRPARPEDSFAEGLRGRRLAHFELIEPIGVGGMAAVIRAMDTHLGRCVALKILPPELASDPENIKRFEQEARAAARLDHENIARAYFCGQDQGLHFIAFEFVEGENLRMILERRGLLPVPEAINYMLQIATGLAHAAERGVVHRDIKPSNIIIGPNGRAKLVDMGLARSLEPLAGDNLTQSGVTLGTFDYISPEQALEPHSADCRSDIYSLGCTFYQLLTGHAAVPEGTYAKKLHHHQHVAPIDPRQLNPQIPDELAAILAKMMAKDPRDRYQRPEHLVQHLVQLAQRLGTTGEVPDGVVFVDAPLPAPPRMRPLLVLGVSAVTLVALVIVHSMATVPNQRPTDWANRPIPNLPQPPVGGPKTIDPGPEKPPVPVPVAEPVRREIKSPQELVEFLAEKNAVGEVLLSEDLDLPLKDAATPGFVFDGEGERSLLIEARGQRRTIRLDYLAVSNFLAGVPWNVLTINGGGTVTLRNLRFEVNAKEADQIMMAAVKLQDSGQLIIDNCEFVQIKPPGNDKGRLSSIAIVGSSEAATRPVATIRRSYFSRSSDDSGNEMPLIAQDAVTVQNGALVNLEDCAFGPHSALVHVLKGAGDIRLNNCSAFVLDGAIFRVDSEGSPKLSARNSVFSNPRSASGQGQPIDAVLVRQSGEGMLKYTGNWNRYHNLNALWRSDAAGSGLSYNEFTQLAWVDDKKSEVMLDSPWSDKTPLRQLENGQPMLAFLVRQDVPELRILDKTKVVGVEYCSWGQCYNAPLQPLKERVVDNQQRKLIVDPDREFGTGAYRTLRQAMDDVQPGDVLLIKKNGLFAVDPVLLDKPRLDLTIRPFNASYHPILTLGSTIEQGAALFHLHSGKLKLENLEFQLKPRGANQSLAVVRITGSGHCSMSGCVVTLEPDSNDDAPPGLAVITLMDQRSLGDLDTDMPDMHLENCFVRGEGALLSVPASQSFKLEADNCLFVLAGSLVSMGGLPGEDAAQGLASSIFNLKRVTSYIAGHALNLRTAKGTRDLVPINVRATDCLFASAKGHTLVHFDGTIPNTSTGEMMILRALSWEGMGSAYSNFKDYLDHLPKGEEMPLMPFGQDKWATFSRERNRIIDNVKFADTPMTEAAFARVLPPSFKPQTANKLVKGVENLLSLPRPLVDSGVLTPAPSDE
ncbi:MAG: protein kinase [Gemmataceae bacterium]